MIPREIPTMFAAVHMAPADWAMVAAFFAAALAIGLWASRRAGRSSGEFFLSGRTMPWWLFYAPELGFQLRGERFLSAVRPARGVATGTGLGRPHHHGAADVPRRRPRPHHDPRQGQLRHHAALLGVAATTSVPIFATWKRVVRG